MVIGFDASRAFAAHRTGTENYSFQILTHLAQIDLTNTYHIFFRPGNLPYPPPSHWPGNFHFQLLPYPKLWTQFGLAKETFFDRQLDILFVPAHTLPLIRRPGLKTVITVHDLGAEYLPTLHQLKQRLYLGFMTHYQLRSASHLIAVSQATKLDLVNKIGIPEDKISVIHEGFDRKLFHSVKGDALNSILKQYDLGEKEYFLFVGTIQPRKNLERLIKAYAKFLTEQPTRLAKLVLAGSRGWVANQIYALPKRLGIADQVKFLGYVPNEDLPALYSGAQALLFPSLFEGFGLPIIEAMACHCPVLTSNASSMVEVAGKAAILVNPNSEKEISKAIMKLDQDRAFCLDLVQLGQKQVQKFSWIKAAQQTLAVLQKTVTKIPRN